MGMAVVDFHLPDNGSRLTLSGRNIGVLQTTVAEIATEKAHQRKSTCRSVDLGLIVRQLLHMPSCHLSGRLGMSFAINLSLILADDPKIHLRATHWRSSC